MAETLAEQIEKSDFIIIGIGNEWNWVKNGLKNDDRYKGIINYAGKEGNEWLLPVIEYEYAYYNSDDGIENAYNGLKKLIGDKKYFLVSDICFQDALLYGFDPAKSVYPCGNCMYLQSEDQDGELYSAEKCEEFTSLVKKIHDIIISDNGEIPDDISFSKPVMNGKEVYLNQKRQEYNNIKYNESAYLGNWDIYKKYLTNTLNSNLLVLELGVGLEYPTVIRWPFEKVTFINKKAHLIRVHERLYQHIPEIEDKTESIKMNSVNYIMQESKGL